MNLEIKHIDTQENIDLLLELDKVIFRSSDLDTKDDWLESQCYLLCADEMIIGVFALRKEEESLRIYSIGILPSCRKLNFGSFLMLWIINHGQSNGYKSIVSVIRLSNEASINLHKKFGFELFGILKNYYQNPNEDGLQMKLVLK